MRKGLLVGFVTAWLLFVGWSPTVVNADIFTRGDLGGAWFDERTFFTSDCPSDSNCIVGVYEGCAGIEVHWPFSPGTYPRDESIRPDVTIHTADGEDTTASKVEEPLFCTDSIIPPGPCDSTIEQAVCDLVDCTPNYNVDQGTCPIYINPNPGIPNPTDECKEVAQIPYIDTDGDTEPDATDKDDECDHIADQLEAAIGWDSLNADSDADDIFDYEDITPETASGGALIDVHLKVEARSLSVVKMDSCHVASNWADPYLDDAGFTLRPDEDPAAGGWVLGIAKLAQDDHIHEGDDPKHDGTIDFSRYTALGTSPSDVISDLPQKFGIAGYPDRAPGNMPQLNARFPLWDHDGPHQCQSGPADDAFPTLSDLAWTLAHFAQMGHDTLADVSTGGAC